MWDNVDVVILTVDKPKYHARVEKLQAELQRQGFKNINIHYGKPCLSKNKSEINKTIFAMHYDVVKQNAR